MPAGPRTVDRSVLKTLVPPGSLLLEFYAMRAHLDALVPGGFDHVMLNPPYLEPGAVRESPQELRRIATVEGPAALDTWLSCALGLLAPRGSLTVVHRADRIDRLLSLLTPHCGDIAIFPVWPRRGEAAKRLLLQARKGHGGAPRLLAGLVLHDSDGAYTAAAQAVLRDAEGLAWSG